MVILLTKSNLFTLYFSFNTIRRRKKFSQNLTKQLLNQFTYFSEVWKYLSDPQKNKILDIIAEGKGIIPHEKIADMYSMFLMLENSFFSKKENSIVILNKEQ